MTWIHYRSLSEFDPGLLYEVLKLRQDIFIIEQDCVYDDIDGLDEICEHLLMMNDANLLVGYLRIVPGGKKFSETSIGRIAIRKEFRGKSLGKKLIEEGLKITAAAQEDSVRIEAQAHLEQYYSKIGFRTVSEVYDLDGIPHLQMILNKSQTGR